MKISVSDLKNEIREKSCKYYRSTFMGVANYSFAIGHWNEFLGFVLDYYVKSICFNTKHSLSVMAKANGFILVE